MSRKTMYNQTMEVKRLKLSTQDEIGGTVQAKITVFQSPCRITQLNSPRADERFVGGKDGVVSTHRIYCPILDIRNKDEVIISKLVYDVNTLNQGSALKGSLQIDVTLRT